MEITFNTKKLKKLAEDQAYCSKELGAIGAKRFQKRLDDLFNAPNLEAVRNLPGNYHELVGNRSGQWSCNLEHPYRLIFTPHENPIPTDASGRFLWIEILGVEIIEIVDYH